MSLHPDTERAIQSIDASLFSGDEFDNPTEAARLLVFIDRWRQRLNETQSHLERCAIRDRLVRNVEDLIARGWLPERALAQVRRESNVLAEIWLKVVEIIEEKP